jgi:hypothetical protein
VSPLVHLVVRKAAQNYQLPLCQHLQDWLAKTGNYQWLFGRKSRTLAMECPEQPWQSHLTAGEQSRRLHK